MVDVVWETVVVDVVWESLVKPYSWVVSPKHWWEFTKDLGRDIGSLLGKFYEEAVLPAAEWAYEEVIEPVLDFGAKVGKTIVSGGKAVGGFFKRLFS